MIFFAILAYYLAAFSLLIATSYIEKYKKYRVAAKTLTSMGFILAAVAAGVAAGAIKMLYSFLPAFIFCLIGDILLALTDDKGKKKYFILGLLSFLTGHLFFALSFNGITPFTLPQLIIPIIGVIAALALVSLKDMDTKGMNNYIVLYSFFVMLLFSKAVWVFLAIDGIYALVVLIGAALFAISDFILLFIYFYKRKFKSATFFNLLTYYTAIFLLAISIGLIK